MYRRNVCVTVSAWVSECQCVLSFEFKRNGRDVMNGQSESCEVSVL